MIFIKLIDGDTLLGGVVEAVELPTADHIHITDEQFSEIYNNKLGFGVYRYIDGVLSEDIEISSPMIAMHNRKRKYPNIETQLDMIFHDLEDGTSVWRDKIRAIKTKYPKV